MKSCFPCGTRQIRGCLCTQLLIRAMKRLSTI
ncbi:hypothetical protein E2320_016643 [Naja naja]|nr:hypothetical protein E2320_016643 [Naja naja]